MKYRPGNHIIGKVYELSKENMIAMIDHIEQLTDRVKNLRAALEIDHDSFMPKGKCPQCDALIEDYDKDV